MKNELLTYYKLIGKLQTAITNADCLEDALKKTAYIIKSEYSVDDIVIWYKEPDDESTLHPNYWICPVDITSKIYTKGQGIVGGVYASESAMRLLDVKSEADSETQNELSHVYGSLNIASMICAPLVNKYEALGCIQFINENQPFTEEDADLFEIISSIIALKIDENQNIQAPWKANKAIVSIRDVKREYLNGTIITQVLKGVNIDIYEGEFVAFLGESGCGKSTLMNIVGGLDTATSGKVIFDGVDLCTLSQKQLSEYRRKNIGFIFQSYNLMPNLTAKQNLDLIAEQSDDTLGSLEVLEMVGLADKAGNYPSQLSGGQQQRVSIARAIVKKPRIIMADEPTAALDYATSIEVLTVMEKLVRQGTTLIMVTHNEEITKMADRVIRIRDGRPFETYLNRHPVHANELVW